MLNKGKNNVKIKRKREKKVIKESKGKGCE